jgi:hypothetical protein
MAELNETNDIYGLEYEWKLIGLRKVNSGGLDDIIMGTNWTLKGTDEDGVSAKFTGATPFRVEDLNIDSFTPFNELDENTILSWIKGVVFGQSSYWEHINGQILKSIRDTKSPIVTITENELPWAPLSGSSVTPQPETYSNLLSGSNGV